MYAKGLRYFEDEPVHGATLDDIDMAFVGEYISRIGYGKSPEEYLLQNKRFAEKKDGESAVSTAAILLFGKYPQQFFPRARIRFIRYDGLEAKVGKEMNVVKDASFEGRLLDQVKAAVDYIKTQMKEKTYLGHEGVFVTEEEYGEFVRTEIVVNAVTHRDYGIKGTDIQVKMFDDRLEVDSPGSLAGMVKKENIRYTHFSRNPKIAAFLKDYGYVKEYGEGVDRMCRELEAAGLPDPIFNNSTFILKTTIMSAVSAKLPVQKEADADLPEKLPFEEFQNVCRENGYNAPTLENLSSLYWHIDVNQVFGSGYITKMLNCSERTGRSLMLKLRQMKVVVEVKGKGKGKYRLKYKNER